MNLKFKKNCFVTCETLLCAGPWQDPSSLAFRRILEEGIGVIKEQQFAEGTGAREPWSDKLPPSLLSILDPKESSGHGRVVAKSSSKSASRSRSPGSLSFKFISSSILQDTVGKRLSWAPLLSLFPVLAIHSPLLSVLRKEDPFHSSFNYVNQGGFCSTFFICKAGMEALKKRQNR